MRHLAALVFLLLLTAAFLYVLNRPFGSVPAMGPFLDPVGGVYGTARATARSSNADVRIRGMAGEVRVIVDDRGVPHIYADDPLDAVRALGYVVARDRLFQMDFIPRLAAGNLSEVFGNRTVEADRFLRRTGMGWAARNDALRVKEEDGVEYALTVAFCEGANRYIDALRPADLPLEFRLLNYRPRGCEPGRLHLVSQYMAYTLSYFSDTPEYGEIRQRFGEELYETLYGGAARLAVPIIPDNGASTGATGEGRPGGRVPRPGAAELGVVWQEIMDVAFPNTGGFMPDRRLPGIGSNNWAVSGERSTTGAPILAGDMHLEVYLPSIWYEAHLVTPQFNAYGVTIPGSPLTIAAFNDHLGWTFTNTGSDQIDYFELDLNPEGTQYRFDDRWLDIDFQPDTLMIAGSDDFIDTLRFAHWGPITEVAGRTVATKWTAHLPNRALHALWDMHHATDLATFNEALRNWTAPVQNILYADAEGNIAIRSTGYMPIRGGGTGIGVQEGSLAENEWLGPIPFEELPHAVNPAQGFLTSTNQIPVGPGYPYDLGYWWPEALRSIRIDTLLRRKDRHSVEDLKRYQADVKAIHVDLIRERLEDASGLSRRAAEVREMLLAWDGYTDVEAHEPLVLAELLQSMRRLMWRDMGTGALPSTASLLYLVREGRPVRIPGAGVPERNPTEVLHRALEETADSLEAQYGWDTSAWRWGDHHKVVFRHMTGSDALDAFGRGPFEYPGFHGTLSPADRLLTMHTASWRVVVDFSTSPPTGYGVYPGGQSGNPFSPLYDRHIDTFLNFGYFDLLNPPDPDGIPPEMVSERITFRP